MKVALTSLFAAVLVTASFQASAADAYSASIQGCQNAIAERLGLSATDAAFSVKKIQSLPHYKDFNFSVSSADATSPIQQLPVSCRAKQDGEVLAVKFDESVLPAAVATH
jgi:hypothetical protein